MAYTHYDKYLESEVLTADPLKLVTMLYRAAIEAVGAARAHLAAGQIRERSRKIVKAWEIVNELRGSLDEERGGEIGRSLRQLYAYMQGRLLEANARQQDAPLAEVEQLLGTLRQGWLAAAQQACAAIEEAEPYEPVRCTY
ncbi:MAG TPA: flagellar export chaperone FliS [Bryobacteraceae bacterium]|jgi:flagellar secretion chaperone FliS|nr:flagellar export chaperone FliS [Bryobacteraceae bacterium]